MGATKITDITSFFNMSPGGVDMPGKAGTDKDLFAQAMTDAAGKGAKNAAAETNSRMFKEVRPKEAAKQIQESPETTQRKPAEKPERTEKTDADETVTRDDGRKDEVVKKAEGIAEKVKEAVKEELSVDDRQLEEAMAVLGLTATDLLDAGNIKNLMLEITGEQDPMVLITNEELLNDIGNVTGLMENAVNGLTEEFAITDEQFAQIMDSAEALRAQELISTQTDIDTNLPVTEIRPEEEAETEAVITVKTDPAEGSIENNDANKPEENSQISPAHVSIQRKEASQSKDGQAESNMHDAMPGQNLQQPGVNEAAAVPEAEYRSVYTDREEILRQVTDNIRLNISRDSTTMELQLHPASLGTVNLQIASNNGVITANLQVQNETVKSVLEAQLVQLLETFEEQGQKVEAIEVTVAGYDLDRSLDQGSGSQEGERKENSAPGIGRATRRRINLNELNEEDIEELTEEEQLAAEMMAINGGNVDYMA